MPWMVESKRTWLEWCVTRILQVGPMPKSIAIIMDGNRRFARRLQKEPIAGHELGFYKMTEVLSWCRDLGISEVTVYALSIANFKRSQKEVDDLLNLAVSEFKSLMNELDKMNEVGVRVNAIGNVSLLPPEIQKLIAEVVLATRHNSKFLLNIALAYTSHDEISNAMKEIEVGVEAGNLKKNDVNQALLEQCLYTRGCRDPDLLIRTSGEVRLSNFLLWQSSFSCLFFTKVLWPEITIWHLFAAIFYYQRHFHIISKERLHNSNHFERIEEQSDHHCCQIKYGEKVTQQSLSSFKAEKQDRVDEFLKNLDGKRLQFLKNLVNNAQ